MPRPLLPIFEDRWVGQKLRLGLRCKRDGKAIRTVLFNVRPDLAFHRNQHRGENKKEKNYLEPH